MKEKEKSEKNMKHKDVLHLPTQVWSILHCSLNLKTYNNVSLSILKLHDIHCFSTH